MRWVALACGALIVISIFLPWASFRGFGMEDTAAGSEFGWGILSLIMGFICAGMAFVPIPKIKGSGHILAGTLAVIGVPGYWSALQSAVGPLMEAVSPGFGLYLCLAAAVAVIVIGIVELRQKVRVEELPEEVTPPVVAEAEVKQPEAMPIKELEPSLKVSETAAFEQVRPKTMGEVGAVISERNRLVAVAIGLIILAIFSSVAFQLPGASTHITAGLLVGHIIKLVIAVVMLAIVLPARLRLAAVITYYAHRSLRVEQDPVRAKVVANIDRLSGELANIVIIATVWPIVAQVVNRLLLLDVEGDFNWISIMVTLAFVALLLYRLYKGYQLLGPVLGVMGKAPQKTSCPKCGAINRAGVKFCTSCGTELQPTPVEKVEPISLRCSKCGAENSPDAKFCESCGTPLTKDTKRCTKRSSSKSHGS